MFTLIFLTLFVSLQTSRPSHLIFRFWFKPAPVEKYILWESLSLQQPCQSLHFSSRLELFWIFYNLEICIKIIQYWLHQKSWKVKCIPQGWSPLVVSFNQMILTIFTPCIWDQKLLSSRKIWKSQSHLHSQILDRIALSLFVGIFWDKYRFRNKFK